MLKFMLNVLFGFALCLLGAGCSRDTNPVSDSHTDHDHAEAVGLLISSGGVEFVRYEKGQVSGELQVKNGDMTPLLTITFIAEDGDLFQPEGEEYTLKWEVENPDIADIVQHAEDGAWRLHVKGMATGSTSVVFKIFHGDHADFVSLPIPVRVLPS